MTTEIKWAAELEHVREVSLRGTADLAFWKERLAPERLSPAECDGRAQLLIIAAHARFHGIRFAELSASVIVTPPGERAPKSDAAFLVEAFNSSRFFAFCERTFFSTPYRHGDVRVSPDDPVSIRVTTKAHGRFHAEMRCAPAGSGTAPSPHRDGWDGPVFLPGGARFFLARLGGDTDVYPFNADRDLLTIEQPHAGADGGLRALSDSYFRPEEWVVRRNATHSKSRTQNRIG